jgi:hypothetical protein
MRLLSPVFLFSLLAPTCWAWLPTPSSQLLAGRPTTHLASSEMEDLDGKIIYQRTHYRLSPGSTVSIPNALVVEERLRFKPDPNNKGYVLPLGPRTFILREGTDTHDISKELYRLHHGATTHSGPGFMDTTIATLLYLASNPELMQGNVLEVECQSGIAGLLGCIGARFVREGPPPPSPQVDDEVLTVPEHADHMFPTRLHHLTLSDEDKGDLQDTYDNVRRSRLSPEKVSIKEVPWSHRVPQRHYHKFYHTIIGSDIDFAYPTAKELARVVANSLLPSNPMAREAAQAAEKKSSGGASFGGMGMEMGASRRREEEAPSDPETEVDPMIPPTFVHVCPDDRDDLPYLRQFLEKGFRMTVDIGYIKLQKLAFAFQILPQDAHESELESMELVPKAEKGVAYQSLTAVHHPDYAGEGSGEYFFPLETGEYEGGSRSTYLEPEAGESPW